MVAVWGSQAASSCVHPQASFLDGRVQCHAHHLLWIPGASCKVPAAPLAHSPPWDGAHITGRMGDPGRKDGVGTPGLAPCPCGLCLQGTSLWKRGWWCGHFPSITVTFALTVPREQCAHLQQHAAARGEDLGRGGDGRHGHSPRGVHGHR